MDTEEQIEQLKLAAELLETGHPWEYAYIDTGGEFVRPNHLSIMDALSFEEGKIRPALIQPPEGKQWMLADKWTQEMLPEGYRPLLEDESPQEGDEGTVNWDCEGPKCKWAARETFNICPIYPNRTRRPLPAAKKKVPLGPEDAKTFSPEEIAKIRHWLNSQKFPLD